MSKYSIDNPMAPPWILFPSYSRTSLGWRMGAGESYIYEFFDWFKRLSPEDNLKYRQLFREPINWVGWYDTKDIPFKPMYSFEKHLEEWEDSNQFEYVYFWGHQKSKSGLVTKSCFSQWWQQEFNVDSTKLISAEQYMMAMKAKLFNDMDIYKQIINSNEQWEIKELGRKVKGFDEEKWIKHRYPIVVNGNYFKFVQNKDLREFLLSTGNKILVEASPMDKIWGVGLSERDDEIKNPYNWNGENLLGFALMEVRKIISETYESVHLLDMDDLMESYY